MRVKDSYDLNWKTDLSYQRFCLFDDKPLSKPK